MLLVVTALVAVPLNAQEKSPSEYQNPILFADYSDPDVIRDGPNYYLVASTFAYVPGIPILQSQDLVHWTIVSHVLPKI
jgi:beta-xylosidase